MSETKTERVKRHFRENKKLYWGILIGAGVAGGAAVVYNKKLPALSNSITQGIAINSPASLTVNIEALGHPGNIIQDLTTGTVYASQNQAAGALGVNPAIVCRHLKGDYPDVKGHVLNNLGPAARTA